MNIGLGLNGAESVFVVSSVVSQESSGVGDHGLPEFGHAEHGLEVTGDSIRVIGLADEGVGVHGAMVVVGFGALLGDLESTVGAGLGNSSHDSFREVGLTG